MGKNKHFLVNCKVYPFDIFVYFGEDKSIMFNELSKKLPNQILNELKTLEFKRGKSLMFPNGASLIYLNKIPNSIGDLATINHEIFHIVCFILERVGITFSEQSDEAYAYLIEYLTKEIYKEINIKF